MDDVETVDRLSELPDSLISEILSLLETRDVVTTCLLSKGLKDLWTTIPYLDFNDKKYTLLQTRNFINGVLRRWKGTKILGFKIEIWIRKRGKGKSISNDDVSRWVGFATKKKVEDLDLHLLSDYRVEYVPECIYSCSSITKLRLVGFRLQTKHWINLNVRWDQLKSLEINCRGMNDELLQQLVSSAPQLQALHACLKKYGCGKLSILSSCLKRLTLYSMFDVWSYQPTCTEITICAPNLEELTLFEYSYTNSRFVLDAPALTDAILGPFCGTNRRRLKQLLQPIQHVEALTLRYSDYRMLGFMNGKWLFSNVKTLKLFDSLIKPEDIVSIAGFFPMVEKLIIDYNHNFAWSPGDGIRANKLLQLRSVEVYVGYWGFQSAVMFQLINCLLKHALMLKKMVIFHEEHYYDPHETEKRLAKATQQVLSLQSSFPTLDIILC